jgi:hypothetical protein
MSILFNCKSPSTQRLIQLDEVSMVYVEFTEILKCIAKAGCVDHICPVILHRTSNTKQQRFNSG